MRTLGCVAAMAWALWVGAGTESELPVGIRLEGDRGTVLTRDELQLIKALFVSLDEVHAKDLHQAWYLQDFQTEGFRILFVLAPSVSVEGIRKHEMIEEELFKVPEGFFSSLESHPFYRLYDRGHLLATGETWPTAQALADWVLPDVVARQKGETYTLLGVDGMVTQRHTNDCAAAAVTNLFDRLGLPVSVQEVYASLDHGSEGALVTLLEVKRYLAELGIQAEGWRGSFEDLLALGKPAILQVQPKHFVVMSSAVKEGLLVLDPKLGRRFISRADLEHEWKGVYFCVESNI